MEEILLFNLQEVSLVNLHEDVIEIVGVIEIGVEAATETGIWIVIEIEEDMIDTIEIGDHVIETEMIGDRMIEIDRVIEIETETEIEEEVVETTEEDLMMIMILHPLEAGGGQGLIQHQEVEVIANKEIKIEAQFL